MTDRSLEESTVLNNIENHDSDMNGEELEKMNLIQKIRNNKESIQILIVLIITSSTIALGIYFKIYELITLSAVVLGWLLATYTINQFQKNRLEKELRDKMYLEYQSVAKSLLTAIKYWNAWSFNPKDEERHYNVIEGSSYLVIVTQTYINRIINQYKLESDLEIQTLKKLLSVAENFKGKIGQSLSKTDNSEPMRTVLMSLSEEFEGYLQFTLYIIQISKID